MPFVTQFMLLCAIIVLVGDVAACDTFAAMFAVDFNFCLWLFVVVVPALSPF